MAFLATLCLGLFGWIFNLHARLEVSLHLTTQLKTSLVISHSTLNQLQHSFTSSSALSFPSTKIYHHHHENINYYQNGTDKSTSTNQEHTRESTNHTSTSTKTMSKSKTSSKAKSKSNRKGNEETHSVNEFRCIVHDEFLHYNFSLYSCYQIFHLVDTYDNNILYAQDICNLKSILQKIIPCFCITIKNLSFSTLLVARNQIYDIDVLKKICVLSDINFDLTLTPNEMCLVKKYIYQL